MFSDNEKISLRQLKRVVVFDLFSISWLIIPRIAVQASGRDGFSAIILSIGIALLYAGFLLLLSKFIENNFMDYSLQSVGSFFTFLIGALYFIKLFACCVLVTRLFGEVIKETLLEDSDTRLILFLLLITSSYAAVKGVEVRARIAEILYFIVLIPVFLFMLMGIGKVDISNLMPLFTEKPLDIAYGGYFVFITFTMLELLLFSVPMVRMEKDCIKKERKVYRYVVQSILVAGVLDLLFFIVTVGILGMQETKAKLWSTITILQSIETPGGIIQRQDALVLAIWMLSIFTLISGFIYYLSFFVKHMMHGTTHKYYIIIIILLLFGACALPMDLEIYFDYFSWYMMYIGMPQSIIIPVFVVVIGKLRNRKRKPALKSMLLLFAFLSATTLTGCKDMAEIEDRNFIQVMGIDFEDDTLKVYYVMPDLEALTGQASTDSDKLIVKLQGKDFWEIEEKNQLQSDKMLDFSHIKAIILGNSLAKDKDQLNEFLQYVENKYELGRNTLLFLAEKEAKDIISLNGDLTGGVGEYLNRLYRINLLNEGKEKVVLGDLVRSKNDDDFVTMVPVISVQKKALENSGLGIFSEDGLALTITEEEGDYIYLAKGYGKNSRLFLGKKTEQSQLNASKGNNTTGVVTNRNNTTGNDTTGNDTTGNDTTGNDITGNDTTGNDITGNVTAEKVTTKNATAETSAENKDNNKNENTDYVIKINNISRKIEFDQSKEKPFLILELNGYGFIEKGLLDQKVSTDNANQELIRKIEKQCNEQIKEELIKSLSNIMKDNSIDFLNLYRLTSYKSKNIWLKYRKNQNQFTKDLDYMIKVNIHLK